MEKEEYIEELMRLNPEPFHGREWAEQDWLNYQAWLKAGGETLLREHTQAGAHP